MKTSMIITIIIVILVILVGGYLLIQNNKSTNPNPSDLAAGDSDNNPPMLTPAPASNLTPVTKNIKIIEFAFMPKTLKIKAGDTVTWTNSDTTSHTVTSDSGTELSSDTLAIGQTYSHTFNTAGTFPYHCSLHPMMKANIVVQ